MNPFSAFLQPPQQQNPLASAPGFVMALSERQRQADQDKLRAQQVAADDSRANSYLALQQGDQAHRFAGEDQKQVEGVVQEYLSAQAAGNHELMDEAIQKAKRFGVDVTGGMDPRAQALTGAQAPKPLPGQLLPDLKAFRQDQPIDKVVAEEQASRDALRAKNAVAGTPEEPLQSQEDFESQLIAGSGQGPERYESTNEGKGPAGTTPEFKARLNALNQGLPEVASAPVDARHDGKTDTLDADKPTNQVVAGGAETQTQGPQAAASQTPSPLPGQLLPPVRFSKGGKTLYESHGQSGRWAPMVSGVFEPFTAHQDPQVASAAKRAQSISAKLIEVDGIAPKEAIKIGMDYLNNEAQRISSEKRTELGTRPKYAGGGGGSGGAYALGASGKADAALNDDVDKVRTMWVNSAGYKKMEEQAGLLDDAEGGLMSPDGVAQNNALATLRRIQSGLTLNAQEMRDFETSAGVLESLKKKFSRYLGEGELPEEYKRQVQGTMAHMRQIINQRMERGAQEAYQYWLKTRGRAGKPEVIQEKGEALRESLKGGSTAPQTSGGGGLSFDDF